MAMDEGNFLSANGNASSVSSNHSGNGCTNGTKLSLCTGCQQPIEDRFVMKVNDEPWHETCLQCCVCGDTLSRSCFSRDHKLYCRSDYEKLFSTKCSKCQECIHSSELVMRAMGNVYHLDCFVCKVCGRRLEKGEEFAIKNNKLYCKKDYDGAPEQPMIKEENPSIDSASTKENTPADNRKGPKRPRTILTSQQRKVFKSSFEISSKPCRKVREELSRDTGLSVRVVQVWFQNQRAKLKKLARRNNPESADAASCRVNNRSRSGKKDSRKKREPPSPCSSPETMSPGSPTDSLPPGQPPFSACNNMMISNSHYAPQGMPNHVTSLMAGPPPPYPPHYQQNMNPNREQFLGVSWPLLHPENELDSAQSVY